MTCVINLKYFLIKKNNKDLLLQYLLLEDKKIHLKVVIVIIDLKLL